MKQYISMARPDHWFKNVFLLPGTAVALLESGIIFSEIILPLGFAILSVCLVASANYVINEVLDADFDKHHPVKKFRPAVMQTIKPNVAYVEYVILLLVGVTVGIVFLNYMFVGILIVFALCGILYNVTPFRMKDRVYLDVIFESFNNVLRLLLGWFVVAMDFIPPFSLIFSFWAAGAFLMATKRYAEYRDIADPERAGLYRKSFKYYTEDTLLISSVFYAMNFAFFFGVFLVKYKIEYILLYPVFSSIFTWYLRIAMKPKSAAQNPHKIFVEKRLMAMVFFSIILLTVLTFVEIPYMEYLLKTFSYIK